MKRRGVKTDWRLCLFDRRDRKRGAEQPSLMEGVKRIKGSKGKEERAELSITLGEKFEAVLFCGVPTRNKGFEASWLKNTQAVIKL